MRGRDGIVVNTLTQGRMDHLVLYADSLDAGVRWCEDTLGITPGPGGEHPLMGTHNRLLSIASDGFPDAYLEIIARQPGATPQVAGTRRWFDLDDAALAERVARDGPQLVHWVARVPDAAASVAALAGLDIDRGDVLDASRRTPGGLLQWRITVRPDGQRLFDGCLPTLIEWKGENAGRQLPDSGLRLLSLSLRHPDARQLRQALAHLGLESIGVTSGPARLRVQLQTPRGLLELASA